MLGCILITYEELNMIHMVGYLTVNTLFTVLHSIEKSIALRIMRDFCDILTVMTVSRAYHNDMCLRSDRNLSHMSRKGHYYELNIEM